MDEDDRDSNASSENEQEQDDVMEDVEAEAEADADADADADDNDAENDEDDNDDENDGEDEDDPDAAQEDDPSKDGEGEGDDPSKDGEAEDSNNDKVDSAADASASPSQRAATTPAAASIRLRPQVRPEALSARLYDIVPTMAAPMATSVNALAVTPDMRYWMTGGTDGYIRKYDGVGTINGKQLLTVAQRHPFVDSVVKAGILMSYWENEEPSPPNARGVEEHILSPVYSLAVHSQALWLLSGTEGGGINLQSVRHDEGKRITCLQKHTNAVSVLQLAPDEKSVLSGSWDRNIFDWDLNNGAIKRSFDGSGGQISAIEPRPASGAPIPQADFADEPMKTETFSSNNAAPIPNGVSSWPNGVDGTMTGGQAGIGDGMSGTVDAMNNAGGAASMEDGMADAPGESDSLFGSPTDDLFGDNDAMGQNPFGNDNDHEEFSQAMDMTLDGAGSASADMTMTDMAPAHEGQAPALLAEGPGMVNGAASHTSMPAPSQTDSAVDISAQEHPQAQPLTQSQSQQNHNQFPPPSQDQQAQPSSQQPPSSPSLVFNSQPGASHFDPTQASDTTFLAAGFDGTLRIWDRRVQNPVARIGNRSGVPPWCMGCCWSPDGNWIYAGRRNGTVEEYNIHKARSGWAPERTLRFPQGSGAVSAVRAMVNGRHLICASHDILRLYDLRDQPVKHSSVPFLIVPGPPRAGVIAQLYIDPTSRFMISIAGTRGWDGTNTEVLIGYEIGVQSE